MSDSAKAIGPEMKTGDPATNRAFDPLEGRERTILWKESDKPIIERAASLPWGNDQDANFDNLMRASHDNTLSLVPELRDIHYDLANRQFVDGRGNVVTDTGFNAILEGAALRLRREGLGQLTSSQETGKVAAGARSVVGSRTAKSAIIYASLLRESRSDEGRRRILDWAGSQLRGGGVIDPALRRTRYSTKQDQPASAGFSFPDNGSMTPENHRRAISKALAAAEKFRREVENDLMVNGNSNGKSVDWDGLDVDGDGDLTELGNQQYLERQEQLIDSLWPNHCIMLRME